jgi:hypothetical protein
MKAEGSFALRFSKLTLDAIKCLIAHFVRLSRAFTNYIHHCSGLSRSQVNFVLSQYIHKKILAKTHTV